MSLSRTGRLALDIFLLNDENGMDYRFGKILTA